MPRDDDKSLGDEATLQGGKPAPADERSLGDRSTFGGGEGSSLSDLGEFADLPDHDMEIVDLSSRYKIVESLGKGGMGEVLLATDTRLDRKVAIKRIRGDAGSSKAAVARFLTEAKSIAALSHNNVVQIHDYGRDEEGPFLIMEYVAGGTLLDRCKQGPIELEEAVDLACQLCDGLARAHDAGIIHRDIKPANILLTHDNIPKLTDFGLAKAESRDYTMTMAGAVLGTLDFMPPEQRQDASLVDARSDLWSLAATLYQMVTGESPKVIRLKNVPAQLQNLLDKALEESKDSRYQTASELKDALTQSQHGGAELAVALEQGVCPSCGTRNEVGRKFCRNTSCAASLQVKCLSCSATIPVWEGVCGECGSLQTDLLEQRREEMAAQKSGAEACLASHDYKRACEIAIEIGNEADPRLQQLKSWSDEFLELVESLKRADIENAKQAIAEALSHEQAYDYTSGVEALNQIPSALLEAFDVPEAEAARNMLAQLQEKHGRAVSLEEEITSRVNAGTLSGLLPKVENLLELLPDRADLLELQQQLQERESGLENARVITLAAAKELMRANDYAGVLLVIEKLNAQKIDSELAELQSLAKTWKDRSQELSTQIRQAVSNHQYAGLLALIDEYLTLKPHDAEALKTRDECEKREQAEAVALLVRQREEAGEKRAAAKQRARKLKIIVGSSVAAAFVLMLMVIFYLRDQQIASDISDALGRGNYVAALELDPNNAEALSMKKVADLKQALSDGDYVAALELDPSNAEALSMKKMADIQQALSEGDYVAALQLDPSNSEALSMKKKAAGLQRALSDGDYVAALELDSSNVKALAMRDNDVERALSDGNYLTVLQLDPMNAKARTAMQKIPPSKNSIGMEFKMVHPSVSQVEGVDRKLSMTVLEPFMIGVHEVTQEQFEQVMRFNPSYYKVAKNPVEQVTWHQATQFCRSLSALPEEKAAGRTYRLPSELEWEHACRAYTRTTYNFGQGASAIREYAWCSENSTEKRTFRAAHVVAGKKPNGLGLYDMHGNVWEWCDERHIDSNPFGQRDVSVIRGGSFLSNAHACGSASRDTYQTSQYNRSIGFRVVCVEAEN
ncbi:protein kinase [bacterium]|nr:protein kinase [bacterium]